MPLTNNVRDRFQARLQEIRNLVVTDVQLTNGEDINVTAAKKTEEKKSEESQEEVKQIAEMDQ